MASHEPSINEFAVENKINEFITQFGSASFTDAVQTCQATWPRSYHKRKLDNQGFWNQVELELHARHSKRSMPVPLASTIDFNLDSAIRL